MAIEQATQFNFVASGTISPVHIWQNTEPSAFAPHFPQLFIGHAKQDREFVANAKEPAQVIQTKGSEFATQV